MGDDITIGVTEIVNNIEVTAQPNDQIIDISVTDNSDEVTLNITPTVVEVNINKGGSFAQWGNISGTLSDQTDLQSALNAKANLVGGKVPASELPSYVDDIIEVANYAALPATGETGKIYVTLDNNKIYRWSGSLYIEIAANNSVWGSITGTLSSQTDLQNALNAKFNNPTGDTTQYIAGDGSLITFPVAGQAGTLVRQVRNTTGSTLTKGTIVYINGANGNKPTIAKAIATGDSTSAQTFGMLQADLANNSNGYVVCVGDIVGLDTSALTEGAQLYLSSTTAGAYTTTKQLAPAHLVYIGVVTRSHPTQGQIEVKIQNGYELDEIHDVAISSVANNQVLVYESATSLWKNKSISTVLGYTPQAQLSGTGFVKASGTTISYDNSTYVPTSRTITINGVAWNLSTDISYTVGGIWGGITGTLSSQTDLQAALDAKQAALNGTGFVKISGTTISYDNSTYALDSAVVKVTTDQNVRGIKTFLGNQTATTLKLIVADYYNDGFITSDNGMLRLLNGTTELFNLASTGDLTAKSFIKKNGTSSQYLMADGSVSTGSGGTVTSVAAITLGTTGTDLSSTVANGTTTPVITLNVPTASATNRGALSAADWTTFNSKQNALTNPITGTGTTNYISKFTGSSAIGNSAITDDGTTVSLVSRGLSGVSALFSGNLTANGKYVVPNTSYFTCGANGYRFNNSDDTENNFIVYNNGNTYSRGNVLIGTTTDNGAKLQVNGLSYFGSDIFTVNNGGIFFTGNSSYGRGIYSNSDGLILQTGSAPKVVINNSGNIGIGVTPSSWNSIFNVLELNGGSIYTYSGNPGLQFVTNAYFDSVGWKYKNSAAAALYDQASGTHKFYNAPSGTAGGAFSFTETMRITSSGNVGIGTQSPDIFSRGYDKILGLSGSGITKIELNGSSYSGIDFGQAGTRYGEINVSSTSFDLGTVNASPIYFQTNGSYKMAITSGGNVGIGITPVGKFHVKNNIQSNSITRANSAAVFEAGDGVLTIGQVLAFGGANNYGMWLQSQKNDDSTGVYFPLNIQPAGGNTILNSASGNVLIGTTTDAGYKLDINGTVRAVNGFFNSDMRLKDLIEYDYNVSDIKPITYLWKNGEDNKKHVGYSAQEVQKVMPDAVNEGADGFLSVNYIEVLVAKIAELENRIKQLEK